MHCAASFASCERMIERIPRLPQPDVVLMDLNFPGRMTGLEGIKHLHSIMPSTRVLVLSIHLDEDIIFQALRSGSHGFLYKMGAPEKILQGIVDVMFKGAFSFSPQMAHLIRKSFRNREGTSITSDQENQILDRLAEGVSMEELLREFEMDDKALNGHIENIYRKLHLT